MRKSFYNGMDHPDGYDCGRATMIYGENYTQVQTLDKCEDDNVNLWG